MTQYTMLNINLSNLQLNKLKPAIKNETEVKLNLSSNLIWSSNDETNFPHKLLLNDTQVSKICKAFANGSSANIKVSKIQLSKMLQQGRFVTSIPGAFLIQIKRIEKLLIKQMKYVKKCPLMMY